MKTLGPATKAALARIVSTLPYLRENDAAVPTAHKGFWQGIKSKYAAKHFPEGASDPLHEAALAHAEEELSKAIESDEKSESEQADQLAMAAPEPAPELETTVAPPEQTSTEPVLGDLSVPSVTEPLPVEEGK